MWTLYDERMAWAGVACTGCIVAFSVISWPLLNEAGWGQTMARLGMAAAVGSSGIAVGWLACAVAAKILKPKQRVPMIVLPKEHFPLEEEEEEANKKTFLKVSTNHLYPPKITTKSVEKMTLEKNNHGEMSQDDKKSIPETLDEKKREEKEKEENVLGSIETKNRARAVHLECAGCVCVLSSGGVLVLATIWFISAVSHRSTTPANKSTVFGLLGTIFIDVCFLVVVALWCCRCRSRHFSEPIV